MPEGGNKNEEGTALQDKKTGLFAGAVTSAMTGAATLLVTVRLFFPWEPPEIVGVYPELADAQRIFALVAGLPLSALLGALSRWYYRLSAGEDYLVYLQRSRLERLSLFHAAFLAVYAVSYAFLIRYLSGSLTLSLLTLLPPLLTLILPLLDLNRVASNPAFDQPDSLWIDGDLELVRFTGNLDTLCRWFREEPYRVVRGSRYRGISRKKLDAICRRYAAGEFYTIFSKRPDGPLPVGIAGFLGEELFLYVSVKHRRRGIGRKALCRLLARMSDVGISRAKVYELRADPVSRKLYQSLGFTSSRAKNRLVRYELTVQTADGRRRILPQGETDS